MMIDSMRKFIAEYCKENKELLMKNDIQGFYDKSYDDNGNSFTQFITEFFFENGVDPLNYFKDTIPIYYAYENDYYTNIVIPEGIKSVLMSSFARSNTVKTVRFPSTINHINPRALEDCPNLDTIFFPESFKPEVERKKLKERWGNPKIVYY